MICTDSVYNRRIDVNLGDNHPWLWTYLNVDSRIDNDILRLYGSGRCVCDDCTDDRAIELYGKHSYEHECPSEHWHEMA